ncbi:MAG: hypothetical protein O9262_10120, partial [Cyclobacteriaceae bacterium]|nr:hypothetical protein [Cyclobacteriaceae bacterium]
TKNGTSVQQTTVVGTTLTSASLLVDNANAYRATVTDNCGVSDFENFNIESAAQAPIQASIIASQYSLEHEVSCAGATDGSLQVRIRGGVRGVAPDYYSVQLIGGSGVISGGIVEGINILYTISNLSAGTYQVQVSDSNLPSCTKIFEYDNGGSLLTLTAPLPLTISTPNFANDLDNEVLFGGDVYVRCKDDASITYRTMITGGNAPYQVNLLRNSTNNFPVGMTALQSEVVSNSGGVASFENLGAGWYKVLVSDAQNCAHNEIVFEIKEAMSLPEIASVQRRAYAHGFNTICYGDATGAITVNATGGLAQGDYTYVLSANDGSADRVVSKTISDPDYTFENLPALTGTGDAIVYSVALRDALGCQWTNTNGVSTDYELQPPAPVTYNWRIHTPTQDGYEILCRGDAATILVQSTGGKFPHSVSLGGTTLVLSDATDSVLFDLTAGNYVLNIVDDSENGGCSAGEPIELTEPGSAVSLSVDNLVAPVCIGGTDGRVEVSGSNGSPSGVAGEAYTFLIRTTGASSFDTDTLRGTAVTFLRPANGYTGQSYDVLVLDQYGCTAQQSAVLPANATPLTLSTTSLTPPSCYGATNGSISLTASNADLINGTDLIFRLSGGHLGNTISSVQVSSLTHTFNNLSGTDINNYSPYRAWVEDVHACTDSADQYLPTLVLTSPSEVNVNLVESIRPTCYNGADGSLLVAITGGVSPYQYSSDNISYTTVSASNEIGTTALLAGDYTYYIRDAQYDPNQPTCQRQAVFTVNAGRQLQLNGELENVSCKGGSDGSIALTVQVNNLNVGAGEVQDDSRLSYSWSNTNLSSLPISSSEDLNNLRRGTYT